MKFINPYLSIEYKIRMLQRFILVQSYIYYYCDTNIVSDRIYDMNAQQLIKLMNNNPKVKTEFSYAFKGFESGTGFDLYKKLKRNHKTLISRDGDLAIKIANSKR